jgi:hypothetical protein
MTNKKAKILLFCMIFVAKAAISQLNHSKSVQFGINGRFNTAAPTKKNPFFSSYFLTKDVKTALPVIQTPFFVICADQYTKNFGFFCKKELQFEKTTGLPLKFRLGSVQYCDWMEGKKTAGILPGN